MKTSLNLNLSQQLTLTPQLQQAIRLLQLSTLELNQEIQEIIESNPLLEMESSTETSEKTDADVEQTPQTESVMSSETIPKELPVDTAWEDIYQSYSSTKTSSPDNALNFENFYTSSISLHEHLLWQMELMPFSETDQLIAMALIDAINDDGFLTAQLEDIQIAVQSDNEADDSIGLNEIEAVLHRIQRFDPVGVGARDLSECLSIQLQQLSSDTPYLKEANIIASKYLDLLAQHNYSHIMRHCKLKQEQLQEVLHLIQSLNPKPGELIASDPVEYIIPDVIVKKTNNRWIVELNADALPRLRINNQYAALTQQANSSTDATYLKNNLQEARWFLKSLQSRHDTLLKVATCIVKHQQGFFEHGEESMKPLILHDIAIDLDLHESTISRVTTQKYMHTPRGVFELKYFFSSHVGSADGRGYSSTAIRAFIKKLITEENSDKPLSDHKIAQLLDEQGIQVARRTIAKYRELMNIPPSNERKSFISDH